MANTTIDSTAYAGGVFPVYGPFWFDDQIAVVVAINSGNDPARYHTTNGGATWSESAIVSGTNGGLYAWFDRNTIGYTPTNGLLAASGGSLVHIVYTDSLSDNFNYVAVNSSGTIGTPVAIVSGSSFTTAPTVAVSCFVVRTRNGNLIAGYRDSSDSSSAVYRSTDGGSTWSSRTTCWETTAEDQVIALQCNTGDDADAAIAFWDASTDEISIKVYDDSANTWTETSVSGSMSENNAYIANMDVGILADGKCFLAAFSEMDSATADLKTWLLDINSVSSPTVTAKTDVLTNTDDAFYPAVSVDRRSGDIYVGYLTGSSATTTNPFYKKSTDTGSTWGSAVAFSDASEGSYSSMHMGNGVSANGGRIVPAWRDGTNSDILTNLVADVEITSDVLVEGSVYGISDFRAGVWGPYWSDASTGVIIYINSSQDIAARKTTDGGQSWGSASTAEAGTAACLSCWFDAQTPGNTGDLCHTVWYDSVTTTLRYASYDLSGGTWSSVTGVSGASSESVIVTSVSRTRNGNLIATITGNTTGNGAWKSTDVGSSWSSIADPSESTAVDYVLGASANTGDDADAAILFYDQSAGQVSIKMYDDSANTWTETSIVASGVTVLINRSQYFWGASTRLSDGHVILTYWNAFDASTADLKCWDLNLNSIASPTATAKTDVLTNSAETACASVFIDQNTDEIYVGYVRGTALEATVSVYYRKSTDGGSSWGSEASYSQQIEDDFRTISHSAMGPSGSAGRVLFGFFDDDDQDIFVNYNNSVSIAAASGFDPATGFASQQPFPSIPDWRRVPAIAY